MPTLDDARNLVRIAGTDLTSRDIIPVFDESADEIRGIPATSLGGNGSFENSEANFNTNSIVNFNDGGTANFNFGGTALFDTGGVGYFDTGSLAYFYEGSTLTIGGKTLEEATTLSGEGAIPLDVTLCKLATSGIAQSITLADGSDGQKLTIVHITDGGSAVLTASTKSGWTTSITFTNVADSVTLQFFETIGWVVLSSRGATVL